MFLLTCKRDAYSCSDLLHITPYKIGNIFDDIINVGEKDKSYYIKEEKAIFIDDSFRERKDVYEKRQIPVFDIDMLNFL